MKFASKRISYNNRLLICNFIFLFVTIFFYILGFSGLWISNIFYIITIYFFILERLVVKELEFNVVHLFVALFYLYPLCFYILFNTGLLDIMSLIMHVEILKVSNDELEKLNFVFQLSNIMFSSSLSESKKSIRVIKSFVNEKETVFIGQFTTIYLFLVFTFLVYLKYSLKGKYIAYVDESSFMFSILSWLNLLSVPLIAFSFNSFAYFKQKKFLIMCFANLIMFALLGIRLSSIMYLFAILTNLIIRGFDIKNRRNIMLLGVLLIFILVQAVYRFGGNLAFNPFILFTVLGEFFFSTISSHYFINDPYNYGIDIKFFDLFSQILPGFARPENYITKFYKYYISKGISPWPAGGLFFYGQLYFYFNIFIFPVVFIIGKFLSLLSNSIKKGNCTYLVASLPIIFMVLPRLPIFLFKSYFISIIFFVFILLFLRTSLNIFRSLNGNKH